MKLYGIYEKVVGVPASSLSQLRGPWPENVEDPWFRIIIKLTIFSNTFCGVKVQYWQRISRLLAG